MINYEVIKEKDDRYVIIKVVRKTIDDKFPVAIFASEERANEYIKKLKKIES